MSSHSQIGTLQVHKHGNVSFQSWDLKCFQVAWKCTRCKHMFEKIECSHMGTHIHMWEHSMFPTMRTCICMSMGMFVPMCVPNFHVSTMWTSHRHHINVGVINARPHQVFRINLFAKYVHTKKPYAPHIIHTLFNQSL